MESIIVVMSLMGNVMLLFYWLLRPVAEKYFTVGWKYAVLKISMIFFILPFPELKSIVLRGLYSVNEGLLAGEGYPVNLQFDRTIRLHSDELMTLPVRVPALLIFTVIWLIGFCVILTWQIHIYIKVKKQMLQDSTPVTEPATLELVSVLKQKLNLRREVTVLLSPNVNSAVTMGIRPAMIILPPIEIEAEKFEYILEHELIHIKHNDFLIRLCALFISALHWFNPISHLLLREVGVVSEYACDESVVLNLNEKQRATYGHTILDMSARSLMDKGPGRTLINSFANYNKKAMKERLSNMKSIKTTKRGMRFMSGVIGLALTMMSMMTAFAYEEPKRVAGDNERIEASESVEFSDASIVKMSSNKTSNANVPLKGVKEYVVDHTGKTKELSELANGEGKALCIHEYEAVEYIRHTRYTDGSCIENYYNAKMCLFCNRIEVGTKIKTYSYVSCPH